MTSKEILKTLIDQRFGGNQAAFSRAIGRSPSQINQWLTGHRNLDVKGCRLIEKALKLPADYMIGEPKEPAKEDTKEIERKLVRRLCDLAETINDLGLMYLIGKAEEVAKTEPYTPARQPHSKAA